MAAKKSRIVAARSKTRRVKRSGRGQLSFLDRSTGKRVLKRQGSPRPRAGRPPVGERRNGPEHRARQPISGRSPLLITMRFADGIKRNMRATRLFKLIRSRIRAAKLANGCRICHFSVQRNHIHFIVEPPNGPRGKDIAAAVSNAMRGLAIRIARAINKRLGRKGSAFAHRYDCRELTTPLAVKNALSYVIHNRRKHAFSDGQPEPSGFLDPCSSVAFVNAWTRTSRYADPPRDPQLDDPVAPPRTWLLKTGWHQKHGGLDQYADV